MLSTYSLPLSPALRFPPILLPRTDRGRTMPRGWPSWLPSPANRPDVAEFEPSEPLPDPDHTTDPLMSPLIEPALAPNAIAGGWYDSSLDLRLGLEVEDLGPVQWLDEWEGVFTA